MHAAFGSMADEFYLSTRLFLKLDLPLERETVLHFFEQIRKVFPSMRKFTRREDGALLLEEVHEAGRPRRWLRLDHASLRFGHFDPTDAGEVRDFGAVILDHAPYQLTFSAIDFDHTDVVYAFDLDYRGNHDQLLAETFWANHPFGAFLLDDNAHHAIDAQPYLGMALTPECELQAYAEVKSRTNTYEIRAGEYEGNALGVVLTLRRYWGVAEDRPLAEAHAAMLDRADQLAGDFIVPVMVNPLAQAIASRP